MKATRQDQLLGETVMMELEKLAQNSETIAKPATEQTNVNAQEANGQNRHSKSQTKAAGERTRSSFKPGFQFWAILFALCFTSLLASLETTVVVTSLPLIVTELDIGRNYVWIGNIFFLTRYELKPTCIYLP
jgi:hypothetical protein